MGQIPFLLRSACSLAVALGGAAAWGEIDYRVTVKPAEKQLAVSIKVPAEAGPVSIQIPNWSPGAYAYGNFYENVREVAAVDARGKALTVEHPDKNTWTAQAPGDGPITFNYWVSTASRRGFGAAGGTDFVQISGPSTYMYVVGRKKENCKISFEVPAGWPLALGLDAASGTPNTYVARTYDVLADAPVSTGQILIDHYTLRGKDHTIVLEGAAKDLVDRAKLLKDCRFVSAAETDFFGGAPYNKYVWHFTVYQAADGAGGLEHLSSTQIGLASGEGPRAQSVLAHEFFHLWNVKRTRAKVLGPFDYLTLPKTGALWWLEGVTDYYATLLPYRYGEWTRADFFDGLVRNVNAVRSNPARLTVSPNDASLRVGEAEGGRGNSNGYQISYYNLGWLSGLCLDTEIRAQTGGKHSLDDVTRSLYQLCKNDKPGFEEDEIRKQCIKFGGPSLGPFYDKIVMTPGEMPIEEQLAKVGLLMTEHDEPAVDTGFTAGGRPGAGPGVRVSAVHGPAEGKLQVGDMLTSINDHPLDKGDFRQIGTTLREQLDKAAVGTPIVLVVKRGEETLTVNVDPAPTTRKVRTVSEDPAASDAAKALREGWLKTKVPSVQ